MLTIAKGRGACMAVLGAMLAAGCSDATQPVASSRFDSPRVQAGVGTVERMAALPVLGSFQAIARLSGESAMRGRVAGAGITAAVERLSGATLGTATAMLPVIRPSVLGTTWVYDASAREYVIDGTRTGAPATGVRFILYELDKDERPIATRPIGHADLTDEKRAAPTTMGIRFVVVSGGVTHLDYALDVHGPVDNWDLDVRGYLSDGTARVDFTAATDLQLFAARQATIDATFKVAAQDFEITSHLVGVPGEEHGDGEIDITVRSGSDRIVVDATTRDLVLDATFTVNGQLLARATGDPVNPVIRGAGGRELTQPEFKTLVAVVEMAGSVFEMVTDILEPAGTLLAIALGIGG